MPECIILHTKKLHEFLCRKFEIFEIALKLLMITRNQKVVYKKLFNPLHSHSMEYSKLRVIFHLFNLQLQLKKPFVFKQVHGFYNLCFISWIPNGRRRSKLLYICILRVTVTAGPWVVLWLLVVLWLVLSLELSLD